MIFITGNWVLNYVHFKLDWFYSGQYFVGLFLAKDIFPLTYYPKHRQIDEFAILPEIPKWAYCTNTYV